MGLGRFFARIEKSFYAKFYLHLVNQKIVVYTKIKQWCNIFLLPPFYHGTICFVTRRVTYTRHFKFEIFHEKMFQKLA